MHEKKRDYTIHNSKNVSRNIKDKLTIWHICHTIEGEEMQRFEIEFYELKNGEIPIEDFLKSLDKKMRAKISGMIAILQESGNQLREPYSKHLEDGIFELRVKVGNDISRVLYFFYYNGKIILTNGFTKKTQKTPRTEIKKAKKYRNDYIERQEKNEKI